MANSVKLKRSSVAGKVPTNTDLDLGEIAINTYDGKVFIKKDDGSESVVEIGSGSGSSWTTKTSNYTAVNGDKIMADTSSGVFTITLPSSPSLGDTVEIVDAGGTHQTNNLTVGRNGENILGLSQDLICDVEDARWKMTYYNSTEGWKVNY